jgi:hypothetical protein
MWLDEKYCDKNFKLRKPYKLTLSLLFKRTGKDRSLLTQVAENQFRATQCLSVNTRLTRENRPRQLKNMENYLPNERVNYCSTEGSVLPGCDAPYFFPAFRGSVVVSLQGLQGLSKRCLKMSGTKHPVRQHHMPEYLIFHPHCCGKLKICSSNVCVTRQGETASEQSG